MSFDSEDIAEFYAEETFNGAQFDRESRWGARKRAANARSVRRYQEKMRWLAKVGDPLGVAWLERWNEGVRRRRALKAGRDPDVRVLRGQKIRYAIPEKIGNWRVLRETRIFSKKGDKCSYRAVEIQCEALPGCTSRVVRKLDSVKANSRGCRRCTWRMKWPVRGEKMREALPTKSDIPDRIGAWFVLGETSIVNVYGGKAKTRRALRLRCEATANCGAESIQSFARLRRSANGCRKCYLKNRLAARNNLGSVGLGDLHTNE